MIGFYHVRMGKGLMNDPEAQKDHYAKAGESYLKAADAFPEDDENHAC